jgi:hypothetical protein
LFRHCRHWWLFRHCRHRHRHHHRRNRRVRLHRRHRLSLEISVSMPLNAVLSLPSSKTPIIGSIIVLSNFIYFKAIYICRYIVLCGRSMVTVLNRADFRFARLSISGPIRSCRLTDTGPIDDGTSIGVEASRHTAHERGPTSVERPGAHSVRHVAPGRTCHRIGREPSLARCSVVDGPPA